MRTELPTHLKKVAGKTQILDKLGCDPVTSAEPGGLNSKLYLFGGLGKKPLIPPTLGGAMSRALLCLICLTMCCACQAPQPDHLEVRRQQEQAQVEKAQELLQRHDKLLSDLRAVQAERDKVVYEATKGYQDILDQCSAPTKPEETCAERLMQYREQYRSVITQKTHHTISALLTRYCYEEKWYDASIQEGKKYLESGTTDAGIVPAVLLYKALSHYNLGQTKEGYTLLQSLQEKYPLSQEATIVRNIMGGSLGR